MKIITKQSSDFKLLKKLSTSKGRKEEKLFIAEGKKFLSMNPVKVISSFDDNYTVLAERLFAQVTTLEKSEGYICIFKQAQYDINELKGDVVILDQVQNPDNVGAIIRNMVAFGFENLMLTPGSCDPYNPKAVRASMGAILDVKIFEYNLDKIKDYNFIVADLGGTELEKAENMALVFGNESRGVSEEFKKIGKKYTIPISDKVNSLNVSVASGIIMSRMNKSR